MWPGPNDFLWKLDPECFPVSSEEGLSQPDSLHALPFTPSGQTRLAFSSLEFKSLADMKILLAFNIFNNLLFI